MSVAAPPLPPRRRDLRVEPFGERGEHVVKDPRSGDFFLLGEREHFLLEQLDGHEWEVGRLRPHATCCPITYLIGLPAP